MTTLAAAIELLESGSDDEALAHLLAAWRTLREPALAHAIDAVSARIDRTRERPIGKSIKQKDAAWHALAEANDPGDTGVLLATLGDVAKGEVLEGRVAALAERAADPRIAMRLAQLIVEMPVVGATGIEAMRCVLDEIERIGDVRTIALLEARRDRPRTGRTSFAASDYVHRRLPETIARVQHHAKSPVAIDGLARIHELVAADPTHANSEALLYAAVYANPGDDGPRVVLADVLQQRADRRGEFIALQLQAGKSREAQAREAELLRSHAREWLGPIEPAVKKAGMKFERGFLAKCVVRDPLHDAGAVLACREWATVIEVDVEKWPLFANDLAARMPVLRTLSGLREMFESHPTLAEVSLEQLSHRDLAKLVTVEAPSLRTLRIRNCAVVDPVQFCPFWDGRVGSGLDHFGIVVAWAAEWIVDLRPRVAVLEVESWLWRYRFEGDELACDYVAYGGKHIPPDQWGALAEVLEQLPAHVAKRVRLPEIAGPTNRVAAAVKRFT